MFENDLIPVMLVFISNSSRVVLSDEYPYARVLVIIQGFLHHFVMAILATRSIRVNLVKEVLVLCCIVTNGSVLLEDSVI